ncbi:MAG: hypothetical protein HGA49_07760 [Eubacteriaceae bacterium]|nr:hypothetical protein [Eubacteriaceae bacterium]
MVKVSYLILIIVIVLTGCTIGQMDGPTNLLNIKQLEEKEENMKQIAEFLSINKNVQMATVGIYSICFILIRDF